MPGGMNAAPVVLQRRVEWSFLRFVRGLYFPEGAGQDSLGSSTTKLLDPAVGLSGTNADRPLLRALAPVIAKGTWRFLARAGGYRNKDVIAGGRKRTGRLWDEPIWGTLPPLTIGHGTVAWLAALHDSLAAMATRAPEALSRTLTLAVDAPLEAGDRFALTAALAPFSRDRDTWRQLPDSVRRIGTRLPFFGMAQPALLPPDAKLDWPLTDPTEQLVLQYLDDWFVASWVEAIATRGKRDMAEARVFDAGMCGSIDALFRIAAPGDLPGSGREHLLLPLARFYPALLARIGGPPELRRYVESLSRGIATTADREAFERGFGTVLRGGVRLDAVVNQIVTTPWADRTESQKRIAAEHEGSYRPVRDEIRQLSRTLRREVG